MVGSGDMINQNNTVIYRLFYHYLLRVFLDILFGISGIHFDYCCKGNGRLCQFALSLMRRILFLGFKNIDWLKPARHHMINGAVNE